MVRHRLMPIKSEKEEINFSNLSVNASTVQTIEVAKAIDSPVNPGAVEIGDTIKWIFFEINFSAETVTSTKIIHWRVYKNPADAVNFGSPNTYDITLKRKILKRGMEMVPKDVSTVIKRIFV